MKKKTAQLTKFMEDLHHFIVSNPQFRTKTAEKTEAQIHSEIRPLIIQFLEKYFEDVGYKDPIAKANKSFYWEGQEGPYGRDRETTFGSRNYPDFIITSPYLIAVEYKQNKSGSKVKTGIGQSIMHTLCEEFHYVYYLFHDENEDKRIEKSIKNERESFIIDKMWDDFNVLIKFV
ncbi:hypothetical protein ACFLRW_04490 [Acidobacteriota bacterium]